MNANHYSNDCPLCHRNDQVQRVAAIVSSGTQRTNSTRTDVTESKLSGHANHYSSGVIFDKYQGTSKISGKQVDTTTSEYHSTTMTDLAKALRDHPAPAAPKEESAFGCAEIVIPVVTGGLALYIAFSAGSGFWGGVMLCLVSWLLSGGLLWFLYYQAVRKSKNEKLSQEYQEKYNFYTTKLLPEWQKTYDFWNQAYYCYRDHSVYVPGFEGVAPPERVWELCHSNTEKLSLNLIEVNALPDARATRVLAATSEPDTQPRLVQKSPVIKAQPEIVPPPEVTRMEWMLKDLCRVLNFETSWQKKSEKYIDFGVITKMKKGWIFRYWTAKSEISISDLESLRQEMEQSNSERGIFISRTSFSEAERKYANSRPGLFLTTEVQLREQVQVKRKSQIPSEVAG